jgi:hypothetical protein
MKVRILMAVLLCALFADACSANVFVVHPSLVLRTDFTIHTALALIIDFVSDFVVLLFGYIVVKKIHVIATWKFVPYFVMVFIGGLVIDILSVASIDFLSFHKFIHGGDGWLLFLIAGLFLFLFNSLLSKRFLKLEICQAAIVGLAMALFTNPILSVFFVGWQHVLESDVQFY